MHGYLVMKWLSPVQIFIFSSMGQYMQWADRVPNVGFVMYHIGGALSLDVSVYFIEDCST